MGSELTKLEEKSKGLERTLRELLKRLGKRSLVGLLKRLGKRNGEFSANNVCSDDGLYFCIFN